MVVFIHSHLSIIVLTILWVHLLYQVTSKKDICIVSRLVLSLANFTKKQFSIKSEELIYSLFWKEAIYCCNEMLKKIFIALIISCLVSIHIIFNGLYFSLSLSELYAT